MGTARLPRRRPRRRARRGAGLGRDLPAEAWVVGGIVNSGVLAAADADASVVARLDEAAGGRPVLLRDVSMHNRWVSSAALQAMGLDHTSPDPEGGHLGRTPDGSLSGVLEEMASALAEEAFARAVPDPAARTLGRWRRPSAS